jgi:hypothetical protein
MSRVAACLGSTAAVAELPLAMLHCQNASWCYMSTGTGCNCGCRFPDIGRFALRILDTRDMI